MTRSKSTGELFERTGSIVADVLIGMLDSGKETVSVREFKDLIASTEKGYKEKSL